MKREMGPAGILSIIGTARGGLWKLGIVWDGEFARHLPGRGAGSMENKMGWGSPEGFGDHSGFWGSQSILGILVGFGDPVRFCRFQGVLGIPRDFGDPSGFQRWSHCKQESLGTLYSMNAEAELKQGAGIMGLWNP